MNYSPVADSFIHQLMLRTIPLRLEFTTSASKIEELPEANIAEIAIVGRSNVGKSSLLNFIAGQNSLLVSVQHPDELS